MCAAGIGRHGPALLHGLCHTCDVQGSWRATSLAFPWPGAGRVLDVATFVLDMKCCTGQTPRTSFSSCIPSEPSFPTYKFLFHLLL